MYGRNFQNYSEEKYINSDQLNTISSFNDKILFKKHSHKINHVDLQKNLLMTSGDDDLIIIVDLNLMKYILIYYDIMNGTKYSKFLESISTRIIYYGYKSFKIFLLDFIKEEILAVVNLSKETLNHFEFNYKSNLLITSSEQDSIVWKLNDKKINPEFIIKNNYYAIINDSKQHIISCSQINNINKIINMITIYKYENNFTLNIAKEKFSDIKYEPEIKLMNFYRNCEQYYLIIMSDYSIEIYDLDDNFKQKRKINLLEKLNPNLKFSYFEPVFTKEIIIGYNNGNVELFNPWKNEKNNESFIEKKYDDELITRKLIKDIENEEVKHYSSVVQIKMSDYYPLYVSVSDEMIIYQLKKN